MLPQLGCTLWWLLFFNSWNEVTSLNHQIRLLYVLDKAGQKVISWPRDGDHRFSRQLSVVLLIFWWAPCASELISPVIADLHQWILHWIWYNIKQTLMCCTNIVQPFKFSINDLVCVNRSVIWWKKLQTRWLQWQKPEECSWWVLFFNLVCWFFVEYFRFLLGRFDSFVCFTGKVGQFYVSAINEHWLLYVRGVAKLRLFEPLYAALRAFRKITYLFFFISIAKCRNTVKSYCRTVLLLQVVPKRIMMSQKHRLQINSCF